ncbi:hypothetical protein Q0601_14965 [Paracoccus onubensis]|nr:hypothetical protein [Paracoccus onubensis]MDP0928485.1 hypothetical protein [Paracoccus onubensis]
MENQAGGGGGGKGGVGGNASNGIAGNGGPGLLLDWIAAPITVCSGGDGCVYDAGEPIVNSPNQDWGSGSGGSMMGTAGAGGDGFLFIVVRADEVNVQ